MSVKLPVGICLVLFLFLLQLWAEAFTVVMPESPVNEKEIVLRLKEGGYIIYMRHGATVHSQSDRTDSDFENCALQRNLSKEGKDTAQAVAAAFKQEHIPVGKVLSSPYCRCKDTARLAFGHFAIDRNLRFALISDINETIALKEHLRDLLLSEPDTGTNTVLVSHTANLKEAAGIWPKPEAVMIVFRRLGKNRLGYIGKIEPGFWSSR
ncbi:MAG: hypothetical protein B5M52_07110 [Helicobacteraceae bacterium 4484_230]|nr:MAG: hypothetical protein B5M52_07110 [Helicobacteraceae bacterium 4484_230]